MPRPKTKPASATSEPVDPTPKPSSDRPPISRVWHRNSAGSM